MATSIFGANDGGRKWSYGYNWFIRYTTNKYKTLMHVDGIKRWVLFFPEMAEAIRRKVVCDRLYADPENNQFWVLPGAEFHPGTFCISFFVDGTFYPICKPLQGPAGDWIGALRIWGAYLAQRSIYGKKGHGVIILHFMLPNGIFVNFGPVSARKNENNVATWSGMDDLLFNVQQDIGQRLYCVHGDKIFLNGNFRCIKVAHRGDDLTDRQQLENSNINKARVSIEWAFAQLKKNFRQTVNRESKQLMQTNDVPLLELECCTLLKNIHNCFNGCAAGAAHTFWCQPPSLDQYLYVPPPPVANPTTVEERLNIVGDPLYEDNYHFVPIIDLPEDQQQQQQQQQQ
jgi:hypothetical protein